MGPARQSTLVLHQFRASHFNDKARWALAYKRLAHSRISYLPGPHQIPIRKLTGQTSTPVLSIDGRVIAGAARIIDALEQRHPAPALYPSHPGLRGQALALQARFDNEVGPATRTVAFSVFVNELSYVARLFAHDEPVQKRAMYRAVLPLVRGLMAKANGVTDPGNVRLAFETTQRTLDWIASEVQHRPNLVGDAFSVADLTVAALMSPVIALDHPDMCPRPPVPTGVGELHSRWKDHPAVAWVQRQYREHRPPDAVL